MSRILLHACCAPCSGAIVEYLVQQGIRPVIFYSNSNIVPLEEYDLRRNECVRYAAKWGLEIVSDDYDHAAWGACIAGLEGEPERGGRCLESPCIGGEPGGGQNFQTNRSASMWVPASFIDSHILVFSLSLFERSVLLLPQIKFSEKYLVLPNILFTFAPKIKV